MTFRSHLSFLSAALGLLLGSGSAQAQFTSIIYPTGDIDDFTYTYGISGNNIVGYHSSSTGVYSFLYDIPSAAYTSFADPLAPDGTEARGIDGANVIGRYFDSNNTAHGFLYNGLTYTTVDDPLADTGIYGGTNPLGISGNTIVGTYNNFGTHAFLYDIAAATFTDFNLPGASSTGAWGVSGSNIVGTYTDSTGNYHGYVYNTTTDIYTTLDDPSVTPVFGGHLATEAAGISGDNIVGDYYTDSSPYLHGFVYNMVTKVYTNFDDPLGTSSTFAFGIDGNNIVGSYEDDISDYGFLYRPTSVPEPGSLALLAASVLTGAGFLARRRKQTRQINHHIQQRLETVQAGQI